MDSQVEEQAVAGDQSLPNWIKSSLRPEDLPRIAAAVAAAEKGSTGEILPVIVHHSQSYRSAKRLFWLLLLLVLTPIFMSVDHIYSFLVLGAFVLLYVLDMTKPAWLSSQRFLVRLMEPMDVSEAVERRAALKFEVLRVQHTSKRTGVMIFISYFERRALILGDKAISEKIKTEEWHGILAGLLEKIGAGQMAAGLEDTITQVGEKLKTHFPSNGATDVDEISNELVILDEI